MIKIRTILAVGLALVAGGCGYNQSGSDKNRLEGGYRWNSLYREDIQSVAVPTFTNRSFSRGLEFSLTQAVIKQIEANAPYKVVSRERADTILEGQIVSSSIGTVSRDYHTNLPREQMLTITVDLIWKDMRSGRILMERRGLQQQAIYHPTLGEGRFAGDQEGVERLATTIIQEMQADW